jgi:hypothetical protein
MAFILRDDQVQSYSELWDFNPGAARTKGFGEVIQDVFAFQMRAVELKADGVTYQEATPIWWAQQVLAGKVQGTGEAITAGQFVYATLASNFQLVTASPTGTIGTDYYFVGVAKKDAAATASSVLIKFWGDEYNHADRAA